MKRKETIHSIITGIVAGLVAGLLVNFCWANINAIKAEKIFLGSQYAYVYSNYKNSSYNDNFRIIDEPLPWSLESNSSLWLAVYNKNIRSLKKATLHVYFPEGIIVDKDSTPWQDVDPNKKYTYNFFQNINNGLYLAPEPLTLKFVKKGDYIVRFAITAEDMPYKEGKFLIKVY
ncbi:MAG: hypothetical protein ISS89_05465 [Candidatus Omnitrophica bacterium]|nr:hypothetical protein [Candidatus Omnitrophota bacterium]